MSLHSMSLLLTSMILHSVAAARTSEWGVFYVRNYNLPDAIPSLIISWRRISSERILM
ncbi:hypothetical protein PGB90_005544 [Kerria lacca]